MISEDYPYDFIITSGHCFMMIAIASAKRCLAEMPMTVGQRLRVLEQINGAVDINLTAEMVQLIEPASDIELAMVDAARALDPKERKPDDPMPPSLDLLGRRDVLECFARHNAGIRAVIERMSDRGRQAYAHATDVQASLNQRPDYFPPPRVQEPSWVAELKRDQRR
jgi:hypothetical protein